MAGSRALGSSLALVDGDLVFAYAKSILRLHDELLSQLASPEIEGHVVLGTPVSWAVVGVSLALAILLFGFGLAIFLRMERIFADII